MTEVLPLRRHCFNSMNMRYQGTITRWDDDKGYGFIATDGDDRSVFVHIKAFPRKPRRPVVGDVVSFEMAKDRTGRTRAEDVWFADQPKPKRRSSGRQRDRAMPVVFTSLFVCVLFMAAFLGRIPWLIVVAYFVASTTAFIVYVWDKLSARMGAWRISEANLHLIGLVCGWPGALAAQRFWRHKSSKREFLNVFWVTVFLNVLAFGYLVWSGEAGVINQFIDGFWKIAV